MTDQDMVAAFLAKHGATRVAQGESSLNYTRRDWHAATRGNAPTSAQHTPTEDELIAQRNVRVINGREHITNGLGEVVYSEVM
jgi:hypothetical protein